MSRPRRRAEPPGRASPSLMFHVSSALNRESILSHGLDWQRMGAAPGIAGSRSPEQPGSFLCRDESEARWFGTTINNTGGPVDVWVVEGIDPDHLVESDEGYLFLPEVIPPERLVLRQS